MSPGSTAERRTAVGPVASSGAPARNGFGRRASAVVVEAYLFWVLFVSTGAVLPLLVMGEAEGLAAEDAAVLRLTLVPILVLAPLVVALHGPQVAAVLLREPWLSSVLLLALLSTLWSVAPEVTGRRAVAFAAYGLLGVVVALRWTGRELLERLLQLALLLLVASLAFQLLAPGLATMADGSWRGAFTHKNGSGQAASFAVLVLLLARRHRLVRAIPAAAALAVALVLLVASRSATSLLVTAIAAGGLLLLGRDGLPMLARAAIVSFAGAGLALVSLWSLLEPERAVQLLGRDPTLTGRVQLWELVLARIAERPWLGWGFHAWFTVPGHLDYLLSTLGWVPPNAHNGYLEVTLGLGLVGMALTLWLLAVALGRALALLARGDRLLAETALVLLGAHLIRNLVESELLQQTGLGWLLLVALLVRTRLAGNAVAAGR